MNINGLPGAAPRDSGIGQRFVDEFITKRLVKAYMNDGIKRANMPCGHGQGGG
jgi:hypothetical protein